MELLAWILLVDVMKNFLGNHWAEKYKELVEKLLKSLQDRGANMSIKVNFLHCHLDEFLDNCSDMSGEQGEWLNKIEHDNQEKENFYHVSLLNDLMKILVGLGIFNHVIFKDLGSDYYCKSSISQVDQCLLV